MTLDLCLGLFGTSLRPILPLSDSYQIRTLHCNDRNDVEFIPGTLQSGLGM
jgi:hypothetical protein